MENNQSEAYEEFLLKKYGLSYFIKDSLKGLLWVAFFFLGLAFLSNHPNEVENFREGLSFGIVELISLLLQLFTVIKFIAPIILTISLIYLILKFITKIIYLFNLIVRALEKYISK